MKIKTGAVLHSMGTYDLYSHTRHDRQEPEVVVGLAPDASGELMVWTADASGVRPVSANAAERFAWLFSHTGCSH